MGRYRTAARWILVLFVVVTGILHFANESFFVAIVPPYLGHARLLVWVSGVCEIAGGLGLLWPPTRRLAGIGLVLLFIAVFPANIHMAVNHLAVNGKQVSPAFLWGRLFLQPLFVVLALWVSRRD